jgi:hypothetical protein
MYIGYHLDTIANNVFAYDADGSFHNGSITANLLPIIIEKLVLSRYALIKVFPGVVM